MSGRILIVGYGNPLRGDDGVGWLAAQQLAAHYADDPSVAVITAHQLTPELAEPISSAEICLLIDAEEGGDPGGIRVTKVDPTVVQEGLFSHHVDPATLVACAGELYGNTPQAYLYTVAGGSFDCEEALSDPVSAALSLLLDQIRSVVSERRNIPSAG
ncbi:MAG TPA: hydrogenase maturation protease [Armatimonadota bacterium]|jgi:hydrogenase maturation protease